MIAHGTTTLGEGFHRVRGAPHAEVEALSAAAAASTDVRGATAYVSLEPCDHTGLTPPCSLALVAAGVARVVVGARDPNPAVAGRGIARLRAAGIAVDVADDSLSRTAIAEFAIAIGRPRPYLRLKMAASLDGFVAPRPGERYRLTGDAARGFVRDLRVTHDAVLVGAGTVRIDDPVLTVRPPSGRRKPYRRVVACETAPVPAERAIFAPVAGYDPTIVLAPAGLREAFASLENVADVVYVGAAGSRTLPLGDALVALQPFGISSVLCEGGPTLAARLIVERLVDRLDWLIAPALLRGPGAVPALAFGGGGAEFRFDRVEALGPDVVLSGVPLGGSSCSAD